MLNSYFIFRIYDLNNPVCFRIRFNYLKCVDTDWFTMGIWMGNHICCYFQCNEYTFWGLVFE